MFWAAGITLMGCALLRTAYWAGTGTSGWNSLNLWTCKSLGPCSVAGWDWWVDVFGLSWKGLRR